MPRDWRDDLIEKQGRRIAELESLVVQLQAQLAALQAQLAQNSSNSNQPPSKDTPEQRRARKKKDRTGRKRGGQPGHEPNQRVLLPPEKVDRVVDCYPQDCANCAERLTVVDNADPIRHQVLDLRPIEPEVTEYRLHSGDCEECDCRTRGSLPTGVPRSMFGPRLLALIGLLTGTYRMSRRNAVSLLNDVLGVSISIGALSEAEEEVSDSVAPAVDEAREFVVAQPIKHVDATSWSCQGLARTLWTVTTSLVTIFAITKDGTKDTVRRLLQRVQGVLVSDRAKVFNFWVMNQRQICWAHLVRKMTGFCEKGGKGSEIARQLRDTTQLMFHYWHRVRDGTMSRCEFQKWMEPVRERIEWLLERGVGLGVRGFSGACADILEHREALWTFVDRAGVDPTNNLAERDLRPFVLWRKTSQGSQSERGERYAERIMTVTHTLRKQGRPVFSYLHQACANRLFDNSPPSLLPSAA